MHIVGVVIWEKSKFWIYHKQNKLFVDISIYFKNNIKFIQTFNRENLFWY